MRMNAVGIAHVVVKVFPAGSAAAGREEARLLDRAHSCRNGVHGGSAMHVPVLIGYVIDEHDGVGYLVMERIVVLRPCFYYTCQREYHSHVL